jgi:outer membrane receptor protein involved in Fe transport
MLSTLTRAVRCALGVILAATSISAYAQQASSSGALEEIVVTAQKREQNSQDVGISVSAITGADLAALGAVTATDITKSMPAVVLTQPNGPSSFTLSIRGITQNDFADHQESPAAIYVDIRCSVTLGSPAAKTRKTATTGRCAGSSCSSSATSRRCCSSLAFPRRT